MDIITTEAGEKRVLLSLDDYEDLVDARDHAVAMAAYRSGEDPGITSDELDDYLAAPTPLAFWRRKRGLTQVGLAAKVGLSQAYVAQIESGTRTGDVRVISRIARALDVRIEDLVAD